MRLGNVNAPERMLPVRTPGERRAEARAKVAAKRGTGFSAREWFAFLRPRLLSSRHELTGAVFARREILSNGKLVRREVEVKAPVFGKPTFRNVIDESGEHV